MSSDVFTMSVRIPADSPADMRIRVHLALVEVALDRGLAAQTRQFEQSCIDNEAPVEHLADLLQWHHDRMQVWRAQTLADVRTWLREECMS